MTKFLINGSEWEAIKWERQLADMLPEDAGFLLYWSEDRVDLLLRLRKRWNTRR